MMSDMYYSNSRDEMLEFLPDNIQCVLEIGCGEGNFIEKIPADIKWGVEVDEKSGNIAKGRFHKFFNDRFENICDCIPDNYFDLVVCNDVIEHIDHYDKFLETIHSKLKIGGSLVGSVPNVRSYRNLYDLLVKKDWEYVDSGILDRSHLRFFTETSIRRTLSCAGFSIKKLRGINSVKKKKMKKNIKTFYFIFILSLVTLTINIDMIWNQFGFRAVKYNR